ncbi:MAG TPA: cyclic nucleotide-binding domain-containing protein, partial [Pyrinomonadaceae bacterium]|nr:cyclic nucleotide-binding domain-containing protein [Pyrinomonadaceae bacterium]
MAVATPRDPATPTRSLPVAAKKPPEANIEWWVEPIKWVALAVFVAIPVFAHMPMMEALSGRIVWTVVVAGIPLFIVLIGYHRWRRLCPLAFFAQIPVRLKRPGIKKASPWLEANYYYVSFGVFFFSLWMRLIATNGDGHAISAFFVMIAMAALIFGSFYTGKTWCNYICPLSFIEKIYTEPHGLRETKNSQCTKCTACKKSCPDINEENGYWKEIDSRPKRFVYYAFPGLVFGFYFYYYLQAGDWRYYFDGQWTKQAYIMHWAFMPGHDAETAGFFFWHSVPRALAAVLTLAVCALVSYCLFAALERPIGRFLKRRDPETEAGRVRHVMFTIAAFAAFTTFYTFAGAPTLWRAPWAVPHLFLIVVLLTATLYLARRMRRRQTMFAEETLARSVVKRWEWTDQPPRDLHEAFLLHTIRTRESAKGAAQVLEGYKDAVREALANGFVTREEVQMLESLRNQLQIKKADHDKIMAALAEEERALFLDPEKQISAEKRLQLETYRHALENYLDRVLAAEGTYDDSFIVQLRSEYRVTREEHAAVLDEVLGADHGMAARLAEQAAVIESAAQTIQALELYPSPSHDFLRDLLQRKRARAIDSLVRGLSFTMEDETSQAVRRGLASPEGIDRETVMEKLQSLVTPAIGERLVAAYRETALVETSWPTLTEMLHARATNFDPYIRALALYALGERGAADRATLERMSADEHELVRETALHLRERGGMDAGTHRRLINMEKMIALRSAPVFSRIAPEGLMELARASVEDEYAPGETLCLEGEPGNEVFILLAGEVRILRGEGELQKLIGTEKAGGFIGELAVLDPAPRSATLVAGADGTRALRLNGAAFRFALDRDPTIAASVIRTLAQRLRR